MQGVSSLRILSKIGPSSREFISVAPVADKLYRLPKQNKCSFTVFFSFSLFNKLKFSRSGAYDFKKTHLFDGQFKHLVTDGQAVLKNYKRKGDGKKY